jgi:hypothetical protein
MKHILIPTDFSVQSLNAVHAAVAKYNEKIKITLFHLLRTPGDIPEILFPSMRNKHMKIVTTEFKEACEILHNRYSSSLHALNIKFGFGTTRSYLQNLLEGEKVDEILICPDIQLGLPGSNSVEMTSLLKKTGWNIEYTSSRNKSSIADFRPLITVVGNEIMILKKEQNYATKE